MKAQIADMIYLIAILAMMLIGLFVWAALWSNFKSQPAAQSLFNATPVGNHAVAQATQAINIINNFAIFVFFIAAVASIVLAALTPANPLFAIVGIITFPIEIMLTYVFHDIFFAIVQNSFIAPTANAYPVTITFMQNFPIICAVLYLVLIIFTFAK